MIRTLQKIAKRFFSISKRSQNPNTTTLDGKREYFLFPTIFPVSPNYFYQSKINTYLYQFLLKHRIIYVAAFPIRPGVYRRNFFPHSIEDLKSQRLKSFISTQSHNKQFDFMSIDNNNIICDGMNSSLSPNEASVKLVCDIDQIYPIGTICKINLTNQNNNPTIFLRGQIRFQAESVGPSNASYISLVSGKALKVESLKEVTRQYDDLIRLYQKIKQISIVSLPLFDVKAENVNKIVELMSGYLCTLSYFSQDQLYQVFKLTIINEKIILLRRYYSEFFRVLSQSWNRLAEDQQRQRLKEKQAFNIIYQNIKRIVGNPEQQNYIDKIRLKLKQRQYPIDIRKLIQQQLSSLQNEGTNDISRKKHYINLLSDYPFGIIAKQQFDIKKSKTILQEEHYGMNKLKQRILQFIAVSKLKGEFKSKVLLLHGPPGVGKTSIVKSIAKCLGRPYARVSLGGQYDTSIIKGHRKTYIGAYPGKIWDSIYKSKVENPVILLDQIDKIMNRSNGASLQDAVMEILDPVQNHKFKDDFMDVEIDLSRVLFICTANTLDTIFPPLLDRLQRIQVSGYTTIQKLQIFKRYIVNQSMNQNGLSDQMRKQINISDETAKYLIQGYCKQPGVRNLVRKTNKIFQKIALKYVKNIPFEKNMQKDHLKEYIGLPSFHDSRLFSKIPPAGVMIGLAYNNYGGSIMYIQCLNQNNAIPVIDDLPFAQLPTPLKGQQSKTSSLLVTGNIHNVMKESCQLAYTYAKYITSNFFNNYYLESNDIHLNFPEIEIGKDGPSAGVAITSALVSLALNKSAVRQIGMTGQITLAGRVSPIGGVKQKTMGAKRQNITQLIFPEDNRKDVDQLQPQIKEGMTFHFANHYFQVLDLLFDLKVQRIIRVQDLMKRSDLENTHNIL